MLDSNTVIYGRDGAAPVLARFSEFSGAITMSAIVFAELQRGFYKNEPYAELRRSRLQALIMTIPIMAFDAAAARAYGAILSQRGWVKGRDFDSMIAAHAISTGSVLVTNNEADFAGIPGLSVENWTIP